MSTVAACKKAPFWIAVDWGTTNFRAFLMHDDSHTPLDVITEPSGLLAISDGTYAAGLDRMISVWTDKFGRLPVLMAGMVGSKNGWQDVGYVSAPCAIEDLASKVVRIPSQDNTVSFIVPGVSAINSFVGHEVMRGEEVQIFGLLMQEQNLKDGLLILPGTHSKQVEIKNFQLTGFRTFMTGEIFSVMSKHSILGKGLSEATESSESFFKGVQYAKNPGSLSNLLFSARTEMLLGNLKSSEVLSYLSGLLIGSELSGLSPSQKNIWLIGSPELTEHYRMALEYLGFTADTADGDTCVQQGLRAIYQTMRDNVK
ncbi:2-dehydro-3-deoxygalactonokinase [Endozoicomonas ascidiicola]|uniref:2-dehydro-3-deoxygalactonokinase n=1 Tax=Endozoicomonas ascidiicola TaxID=1698521 RepID=UPI000833C962|nr:2-dehydro-3-deoxygalactonokinase [Endozoicomonas ascidiicola]